MIKGLPHRLKKLRLLNHLTQKDVANRLNISPSIVSGYETGERTPSTEILLALSYLYHCSTDYLLGKADNSPNIASSAALNTAGLTDKQIQALVLLIDTMRTQDP